MNAPKLRLGIHTQQQCLYELLKALLEFHKSLRQFLSSKEPTKRNINKIVFGIRLFSFSTILKDEKTKENFWW